MAAHDGGAGAYVKGLADDLHAAISSFARMDALLITAVNGVAAYAGFSLAVIGDLVLAGESASFTMAYTRAGLSPDGGASYYLPRLIGLRRTQDLMLTNRALSAGEALDWGLVHRVVPDAELATATAELAERFAAGPKHANASVKKLLLVSSSHTLEEQLARESAFISACADSPTGKRASTPSSPSAPPPSTDPPRPTPAAAVSDDDLRSHPERQRDSCSASACGAVFVLVVGEGEEDVAVAGEPGAHQQARSMPRSSGRAARVAAALASSL